MRVHTVERARDAFRRYGLFGVAARLWSRTIGLIVDIDVYLTFRSATGVDFEPVPGFRYVSIDSTSPRFHEAARLLGVDPERRALQSVFAALDGDGRVVACVFNDPVDVTRVNVRGIAVSPDHRRKGLGESITRFQAHELARTGATAIDSHVSLTNRPSRKMYVSSGSRVVEVWIFLILFRRFRWRRRVWIRAHETGS